MPHTLKILKNAHILMKITQNEVTNIKSHSWNLSVKVSIPSPLALRRSSKIRNSMGMGECKPFSLCSVTKKVGVG